MAGVAVLDEEGAAQELHVTVEQLKEYVDQGLIDADRLPGGILRFDTAHLRDFLDRHDTRQPRIKALEGGTNRKVEDTRISGAGLQREITEFVQAVMESEGIQASPHVTDHVLVAISNSPDHWPPHSAV